jgi:hypothetical protein
LSEIRATTISDSAGTGPITLTKQSAAKAWINYKQAATFDIRDSINISSVSDEGSGLADTNYTNNFDNTGYAANGGTARQSDVSSSSYWTFPTRGSSSVYTVSSTSWTSGYNPSTSSGLTALDCVINIVTIHGDLA